MRMTIAAVFAAAFTISVSAQDFMAEPGTPAIAFPKPDRPVAFGIVDAYGPTSQHGTPPGLLHCELAAVGYREISLDRLAGSNAYLAIFEPPSVANRTPPMGMIACKAL